MRGVPLADGSRIRDEGARGSLSKVARPASSRRGTRLTLGPLAEPEEASGRLTAESQIEPWFACARPQRLASSNRSDRESKSRCTMRHNKKTAPGPRKHRQTSSPEQPGLIAQGKNRKQSARGKCALYNRSHRTTRITGAAR